MGFLSRLFGGSQEAKTSIPAWLEQAGQDVFDEARRLQGIGFVPYRGPDVAALSPMQQAAMAGTQQMASAFGMPTGQGNYLPQAQRTAGGVRGYSSAPGFDAAVEALRRSNPEQYAALMRMQRPQEQKGNGEVRARMSERDALIAYMTGNTGESDAARRWRITNGDTANNDAPTGSFGGGNFTGLRDMVDGGGPGQAGPSGGALGFASRWATGGPLAAIGGIQRRDRGGR